MVKKTGLLVIMGVCLITLLFGVGVRYATSSVANGPHDLSFWGGANFAYDTFEICVFCHTPHGGNTTQRYLNNPNNEVGGGSLNGQFLWNRRLPSIAFSVYTSTTLNADTSGGPGTMSLLCLSCHDGVGAMNVLLNNPADTPGGVTPIGFTSTLGNQFGDFSGDPTIDNLNIGGANCVGDACAGGGDLRNDHPIGFDYATALAADPGLKVIVNAALLKRMALTGNMVECNTCHDPHLTNPGGNSFLVVDNAGSALCLACHNK